MGVFCPVQLQEGTGELLGEQGMPRSCRTQLPLTHLLLPGGIRARFASSPRKEQFIPEGHVQGYLNLLFHVFFSIFPSFPEEEAVYSCPEGHIRDTSTSCSFGFFSIFKSFPEEGAVSPPAILSAGGQLECEFCTSNSTVFCLKKEKIKKHLLSLNFSHFFQSVMALQHSSFVVTSQI